MPEIVTPCGAFRWRYTEVGGGRGDRTPCPAEHSAVHKTAPGASQNTLRHSVADLGPIRSALARSQNGSGCHKLLPSNAGRLALRGCSSYLLRHSFCLPRSPISRFGVSFNRILILPAGAKRINTSGRKSLGNKGMPPVFRLLSAYFPDALPWSSSSRVRPIAFAIPSKISRRTVAVFLNERSVLSVVPA